MSDDDETVLVGLRSFPAHKLILICHRKDKGTVEQFSSNIRRVLKIPIDIYTVGDNILENVIEIFNEIQGIDGDEFDDIIVNVAGGDKLLGCAALTSAFINGLKAFSVMGDMAIALPILKLSYKEIVSKAKINILRTLMKAGGKVESLEQLSKISCYGKPLISYHIHGAEDSRGLLKLGLVEVERKERGRMRVKITALGRLIAHET